MKTFLGHTGRAVRGLRGPVGRTVGRARNAFTILWDSGWITDEEVRTAVTEEMGRRVVPATASAGGAGGEYAQDAPRD